MISLVEWQLPPQALMIDDVTVHLWRIPLTASSAQLKCAWEWLDNTEQQRAQRFHFKPHQYQFVLAHGGLRWILSRYLGVAPQALLFSSTLKGKPQLLDVALQFNLSHSENFALCAITQQFPLGVDIEKIKPMPRALALAERFFTKEESAYLHHKANSADITQTFFTLWTAKEALIKALGEGLAFSLKNFVVQCDDHKIPQLISLHGDPQRASMWKFYTFFPVALYCATVAVNTRVQQYVFFNMPEF